MPCALPIRSEEHTSELQSSCNLVCRLLLEKKKNALARYLAKHSTVAELFGALGVRHLTTQCVELFGHPPARLLLQLKCLFFFFFFNDRAPPEIYPFSLQDAFPI